MPAASVTDPAAACWRWSRMFEQTIEYSGGAARARSETPQPAARSCRSIWISDLHLGTRRCCARELVEFLEQYEAEYLYLVGDIVDGWVTGPSWYWSREQGAVTEKINDWH